MVAVCKPITFGKKNGKPEGSRLSSNASRISEPPSQARTQLELELINMTKDHEMQKGPMVDQIDLLKQELDELLSEHSERGQKCSKEYKELLDNLATTEGKIMNLTSEYFKLRMNSYEDERQLQEEN